MTNDKNAVFTINDIDLTIAPESISVQKEDLIYEWRTLRTSQSTKIPSGHGQSLIQVHIPFKDRDILAVQRLILEFRHSPFCFIENIWLRQDLCPEWPLSQKMAFTLRSLDIVPYPETSDAWIVNLELTWFNYFPYVHNWLYRRDWHTEWLSSNGSDDPYEVQLTIGWDIDDDGKRKGQRYNVINERKRSEGSNAQQSWSTLQSNYTGKELAIEDLEILHRGEIFDLLPMPNRMNKAFFVPQPSESLIYKRYINFLQRDALKKHFDFDLEAELETLKISDEKNSVLYDLLFRLHRTSISEYVVSIHEASLPKELEAFQRAWNSLREKIRSQILKYKPGVEFVFATYKSVQLPSSLAQATQKIVNKAKNGVVPRGPSKVIGSPWMYADDNTKKARVRRGLTDPSKFHTPVGNFNGTKRDFATLAQSISDDLHWRAANVGVSGRSEGFHWGLDIMSDPVHRGAVGIPVYAVKAGKILTLEAGENNSPMKLWKCLEYSDGAIITYKMQNAVLEDFLLTANHYLKGDISRKKAGTVLKSINIPDRIYYVDLSTAGKYVELSHNGDKERSRYLHLAWVNPELYSIKAGSGVLTEEQVKAGFVLGTIGESYSLDTGYVFEQVFEWGNNEIVIPEYLTPVDGGDDVDYSKISPHLHFEYYERSDWKSEREAAPTSDDNAAVVESTVMRGFTVVDPIPTFQYALSQGISTYIDEIRQDNIVTLTDIEQVVDADTSLDNNSKLEIVNILDSMYEQGYIYYDRQEDITNVWWKPWRIAVQSVNEEYPDVDDIIKTDSVVLTNVNAGLRHIVTNIPILGHEFPTQQHLGSIEPFYNLEFHLLDDSNTLEGIGESGGILSGLRFLLQHNARKFRSIPDSWCLITDNFLTRLLGTLHVSDFKVSVDDKENILTDTVMNRRTIIARTQLETVQGNPGLSRLILEVQETNPWSDEAIEIEAPKKVRVDEAREKILNALYHLDFIDSYKNYALKILIAQMSGANTNAPGESDFGQFTLGQAHVIGDLETLTKDHPTAYITEYSAFALQDAFSQLQNQYNTQARVQHGEEGSEPVYIVRDDNRALYTALDSLGIPVVSFNGSVVEDQPNINYVAISERSTGLGEYKTVTKDGYTIYDISSLLNTSQETLLLGEIPISKIQELGSALRAILSSAEMYMSEESTLLQAGEFSGNGLTKSEIVSSLYNLPIEPRLWRTYQYYLAKVAAFSYWPKLVSLGLGYGGDGLSNVRENFSSNLDTVYTILQQNPNWLVWKADAQLPKESFKDIKIDQQFDGAIDLALTATSPVSSLVFNMAEYLWENTKNTGRIITALGDAELPKLQGFVETQYNSAVLNIVDNIVEDYVRNLPLTVLALSEESKDILEDSMLGDIFGNLTGDGRLPAIANTMTRLKETILSSGYFAPHPFASNLSFFLEPSALTAAPEDYLNENNGSLVATNFTKSNPAIQYQPESLSIKEAMLENNLLSFWIGSLAFNDNEFLKKAGLEVPGSAFSWRVDSAVETEKLRYFKQLLARLADSALQDPGILKAFGLEELSYIDRRQIIKGKEAYPDLNLPYHPYYGDTYSVYPDFYMWNMYEDGDVFNSNIVREIQSGMGFILKNCYASINKLQIGETGENSYKPARDKMVLDASFDEPISLNIKYNAEGSDGTGKEFGPTAYPYYPSTESESGINSFFNQLAGKNKNAADQASLNVVNGRTGSLSGSTKTKEVLSSTKVENIKLTNVQEGVQYPSRLTASQYTDLQAQVAGIETMFGSRAGYLESDDLPTSVNQRLDGTPLERDQQPSHRFDLLSLQNLANNAAIDMFSQKRRMAHAYPTFKLYFVEEDEWESRLLNFDDFYSYNGVKDFTVTSSRKNPADLAVITLQNVSGVLDGTKRDAIVDLDYFSQKMKNKTSAFGDVPEMISMAEEQPFGALVLRPGLNVQLRAGYSNDPDNLNVLINGRVVDVQWSQQGDLAQITVQSFGTELMQILKNSQTESDLYHTTHQLLGALLLEPELIHFGRWEFGQLFQKGEAKDSRFDFFDYSKEANFGRFEYSSKTIRWFFDHPLIMYGLALGGVALASKLPGAGRMFSRLSRWGTRFNFVDKTLAKFSISPQMSRVFNKVLGGSGIFGRLGKETLERELITEVAQGGATGLITNSTKVSAATARKFIEDVAEGLSSRAGRIGSKDAGVAFGSDLESMVKLRAGLIAQELERVSIRNADELTIGRVATAVDDLESEVAAQLLRGQWLSDPYTMVSGSNMIKQILPKAGKNILDGATTGVSKLLLGVGGGVAVAENIAGPLLDEIYKATIGRISKYFQATKVSLMLSPQDDNLFPPHPKDYMLLKQGLWEEFKTWFTFTASAAITGSEELGNLVGHYFRDADPFDKRAPAESYQYRISNSYIWDVLHEMTLRHPGWIYAVRPYGKQFRYTLFFGVPSQRYWAVPADNSFISRVNKVSRFLENDITMDEYRSLYGDSIDGVALEDVDEKLVYEAIGVVDGPGKLKTLRQHVYGARALQEYLRALNLRFIPFRRYHTISSEIDLVWNGIIGSENSTYNAVDVTYFPEDIESETIGPSGTALIKAHAFIPENMLRVKPAMPYPNCRGYSMAMRYGMGELLYSMRDMYRGEILTLGNARIMPWDIIILQDTYNSMVGPIEVEQVVHQYSFETGFITEVKPSAVVLANETSSWPLLEAMKLAALAVRNVENDALGITADSFGTAGVLLNWLVDNGPGGDNPAYNDYAKRKMEEIFGEYWDSNTETFSEKEISEVIFGAGQGGKKNLPGEDTVKSINDSVDGLLGLASGIAVLGAVSSIGLGYVAGKNRLPFGKQALFKGSTAGIKRVGVGALSLAGLGSSGIALTADALIDPPQLVSLLGGNLLLLQCLRGDTIMVVPLMKNGYPIVAGLNYHDPAMIWNNFLGDLGRFVDDTLDGTKDLLDLWKMYGMYAWRRLPDWDQIKTNEAGVVSGTDLTGEF